MTMITPQRLAHERLPAGHVLALELLQGTGAVVQLSHAGRVVESVQISASRSFGPYMHDMTAAISCFAGSLVDATVSADTAPGLSALQRDAGASLASAAGTITAAALLTTAGTTGQVVRLSDGDDKGALLMWSTPEGATAETWCWWLWPQAAY